MLLACLVLIVTCILSINKDFRRNLRHLFDTILGRLPDHDYQNQRLDLHMYHFTDYDPLSSIATFKTNDYRIFNKKILISSSYFNFGKLVQADAKGHFKLKLPRPRYFASPNKSIERIGEFEKSLKDFSKQMFIGPNCQERARLDQSIIVTGEFNITNPESIVQFDFLNMHFDHNNYLYNSSTLSSPVLDQRIRSYRFLYSPQSEYIQGREVCIDQNIRYDFMANLDIKPGWNLVMSVTSLIIRKNELNNYQYFQVMTIPLHSPITLKINDYSASYIHSNNHQISLYQRRRNMSYSQHPNIQTPPFRSTFSKWEEISYPPKYSY